MNRKFLQFLAVCMVVSLVSVAWAQESSKEFQESKEDFLKALGNKPTPASQTGTARTKGLKGLALITPDDAEATVPETYEELELYPAAKSRILFDTNSDAIKSPSYAILRNLAEVLRNELVDAKFVIAGHTDERGKDEYNLTLSKRRAQAVKDFLVILYDIDSDHLLPLGFGESEPIASNDTEEGRAKNRRVEFIRIE